MTHFESPGVPLDAPALPHPGRCRRRRHGHDLIGLRSVPIEFTSSSRRLPLRRPADLACQYLSARACVKQSFRLFDDVIIARRVAFALFPDNVRSRSSLTLQGLPLMRQITGASVSSSIVSLYYQPNTCTTDYHREIGIKL